MGPKEVPRGRPPGAKKEAKDGKSKVVIFLITTHSFLLYDHKYTIIVNGYCQRGDDQVMVQL